MGPVSAFRPQTVAKAWTVVDMKRDWKTVLPEMKEQAK
jgi:hypothetical protein